MINFCKKGILAIFIILLVHISPCSGQMGERPLYVPGELLIRYRPMISDAAAGEYEHRWGMKTIRSFKRLGIRHLRLPTNMSVEAALDVFRHDPDVISAHPNYYRYIDTVPNDPDFAKLWGLDNIGQRVNGAAGTQDADIDAPEAWDLTTGDAGVVVAVLDSGIDYHHPDLINNLWSNPGEIAGNGIDDDGNGYIDDVRGWDFVDNDNAPFDQNGHGTNVAGTVAASGNNGKGTTGVGWNVKIMVLRVLNAAGSGTDAGIIKAIDYAADKGAAVINCSFGGVGGAPGDALSLAIGRAGALVVCAAGNSGTDNDILPTYPACYDNANIIAVAATSQDDDLAYFSNYGEISVDVGAPGINIYSSAPADRQNVFEDNFDDNDISDWQTGGAKNKWAVTDERSLSGANSLTDGPNADYQAGTDSWALMPILDLTAKTGSRLSFEISGQTAPNDVLHIETSKDAAVWTPKTIELGAFNYSSGISIDTVAWKSATVGLEDLDGEPSVYIRFHFVSDDNTQDTGIFIDDVSVSAAVPTDNGRYEYVSGTSISAPHVSGIAALFKSRNPAASPVSIKTAVENGVDQKASLSGVTATGGRVNAFGALAAPPAPKALNAAAESDSVVELSWSDQSENEIGFKIERKTGSGDFSQIGAVGANVNAYNDSGLSGKTTYIYRVRAYNSERDSSYSNEAEATTLAPASSSGDTGCFITTAASGSRIEKHIVYLRGFRDAYLMRFRWGRDLVGAYYWYSPAMVDFISKHERLQDASAVALLPLVGLSYAAVHVKPITFIVLLVTMTALFLIAGRRFVRSF